MHILLIVNEYPSDWDSISQVFCQDQARTLARAGHKIGILVIPSVNSMRGYISHHHRLPKRIIIDLDQQIPVYRTFWGEVPRTSTDFRVWMKWKVSHFGFLKYIHNHGYPDIIHAHNSIYSGYIASQIFDRYKIPYVITEHFSGFLRGLIRDQQKKYIRTSITKASRCLAVSSVLAQSIPAFVENVAIDILANVVDTNFFAYADKPDIINDFKFLCVARFDENKSHDILLKAFAEVFRGKAVRLYLIGDGILRATMQDLANELGISSQVTFLGKMSREQIRNMIYTTHCVVSSSKVETFGLSLLEALSCGRPVISTRSGGPDSFIHPENGLLAPINDIGALGKAMVRVIDNYQYYDPLTIRTDCISKFSEQTFVSRLGQIYTQIVS